MLKAVLYDLDGTLLPVDMGLFMKDYFKYITAKMQGYGFEGQELIDEIWKGTAAMVANDGSCTNEDAFWKCFAAHYGQETLAKKDLFEEFYRNEFNKVREVVEPNPLIPALIKEVKAMGLRQILATNPVFPHIATQERIEWADLDSRDFEFFTAYEDSHYCKPNLLYYREVLERAGGLKPEDCLMVGNDMDEDMAAGKLGMKVFLVTDHMLNKHGRDLDEVPHGDFGQLLDYIRSER